MASVVDICNIAMHRLGLDDIASLTEGTQKSRLCASTYPLKRELMLQENVWTFARKRVVLPPRSDSPPFVTDFSFWFDLPADYIRMVETEMKSITYLIEGRQILFGQNTLNIIYIQDITDPNAMSALFREALGLRIASELCAFLTGSLSIKGDIDREYMGVVARGATADAQSNGEGIPPDDDWILVRC